ncbi:MAG TPA: hypothetical protein VEB65_13435, partial [Solirubrobacterales bacterium]|nr:hypothetical protein [Solirubrobacterales bacterium]
AYLDLTGLFSPKATMRRIAAEIREVTGGLTCSVGISESRLLAKITSELGKPAGLVVLSREDALARFADHSPGLVPGIGPKTLQRLEAMGATTLSELRENFPRSELEERFGPRSGAWLHARARLEDSTPVSTSRETKSQSAETTFDYDVADLAALERHLAELAEELCRRLAKRDLAGRSIGIKVRLDDWTNVSRSHSVAAATNDPEVVRTVALDLLRAYDPPRPVRLLGVRVASFEQEGDEGCGAAAEDPEGPPADGGEGEAEPQLRLSLPS